MSQNEDPIRKHSDLPLQIIKDKTVVELDYSLGSLLYLDKLLEHLFGKGMERIPEEGMEDLRKALRLQIACYYGECIREAFSGVCGPRTTAWGCASKRSRAGRSRSFHSIRPMTGSTGKT